MRTRNFLRSCYHGLVGRAPAYLFGAVFTAGLAFSLTSYAVHDVDVFELDNGTKGANAIDQSNILNADAINPDDWARNNFLAPDGPSLDQCYDLEGNLLDPQPSSCGYVAGPNVDPANPGGSAFRSLFIQDPNGVANNDDIFTGGGSKDDLDVSQWQWTSGSPPDKDDLLPIGAAAYLEDIDADTKDELLIYLFGTLFAPNGSAAIGAWLFKKNIGTCPGGTFGVVDDEGNCLANQPSELHTVGDVFVVAETDKGGRNVLMQVFTWVGSDATAQANCVAAKPLGLGGILESPKESLCKVLDEANAVCSTGLVGDDACGSMNLGSVKEGGTTLPGFPTESPDDWGFQSKFPPSAGPAEPAGTDGIGNDDFPETSLFEAGFNFSNLFPDEVGCFNSFLMNTRSSHVVRAQLKDLALGNFPLCGLEVDKTGPEKSKVGDTATYEYTITNTGAITLYRVSVIDDVIGDLTAASGADCAELAPQASCTFEVDFVIPEGADDPLVNTVTVVYNSAEDLSGDDQSATDDHSVNLFQPSITFAKTGDDKSKIGDEVEYTITLNNTSSNDTPDLVCTITDTMLGIDQDVTLVSGAEYEINKSHVIPEGAADPYENTASVTCSPDGFPNVYDKDASHSVDLFQPSITFTKTGDELSKIGDGVDYTITLNNTSSADTPDLVCTITDTMLGVDQDVTLASGESSVINKSHVIPEGAADPYENTASVTCSPDGFPNVYDKDATHSVNLFQPSINLVKTGDELSKATDDVNYVITLNNTSSVDSPDLECTIIDAMLGINENVTVASGADYVINAVYTVQAEDPDPLPNTASASCSPIGFPNVLPASDDHLVELFQPSVTIDKTADCDVAGVTAGADITYSYLITNTSSGDSPNLDLASVIDNKLGDLTALAAGGGCSSLAPGATCSFDYVYTTVAADVGTVTNHVDVLYHPAGFPNSIPAEDDQECLVVSPGPAFLVIEKVLLNTEGSQFNYTALIDGIPDLRDLIPLFAPTTAQYPNSPFDPAGAGNGFATLENAIQIDFDLTGETKPVSVTEEMPLPPFISLVSLECRPATDDPDGSIGTPVYTNGGATAELVLGEDDIAFCRYVNEFNPGDEGCTPGYWKQPQHFGSWTNPPYDPFTTQLQDVFNFVGVNGQIGGLADDLMLDALSYQGGNGKLGAAQILLRAAVAAVLNASHNGVQYAFTELQVINLVNDQLLNGTRDSMLALATELDQANNGVFNDNGGTESCPLGLNPLP